MPAVILTLMPNVTIIILAEMLLEYGCVYHWCSIPVQPTTAAEAAQTQAADTQTDNNIDKRTAPPESTFKKLLPAKSRYTLLRDEL